MIFILLFGKHVKSCQRMGLKSYELSDLIHMWFEILNLGSNIKKPFY
jgi:hypothetical protein